MEIISIKFSILFVLVIGVFIGIISIKKRFTKVEVCPLCKNTKDFVRVKRSFFYKIIPYLSVKKFYCLKCHNTHYKIIK